MNRQMVLRIVVTGAAGRLGAAVCAELAAAGHHVAALTHADLDIRNTEAVNAAIGRHRPHAVVNCAAYNAVDAAETDVANAFALNVHGPSVLARAATSVGAFFVHYGTDFVFAGEASAPYVESDRTSPLSVYGHSKLAGELEAGRVQRHYILRVESLFGGTGVRGHRATVDYIIDTLIAGGTVRAVVDRTVTPSYVPDVARVTRSVIERNPPYGIYHCVNSGSTTWYELAHHVARQLGIAARIEPVRAADLPTRAPRPRYCALSNRKLLEAGIAMPDWQSAIARHLAARVEHARSAVA